MDFLVNIFGLVVENKYHKIVNRASIKIVNCFSTRESSSLLYLFG